MLPTVSIELLFLVAYDKTNVRVQNFSHFESAAVFTCPKKIERPKQALPTFFFHNQDDDLYRDHTDPDRKLPVFLQNCL